MHIFDCTTHTVMYCIGFFTMQNNTYMYKLFIYHAFILNVFSKPGLYLDIGPGISVRVIPSIPVLAGTSSIALLLRIVIELGMC